jgi:hypothetical protein
VGPKEGELFSRKMNSTALRRSNFSLLSLPNDVLILILEHLSFNELKSLFTFVSDNHPDDFADLVQLFNHCDGHLFHRFPLNSDNLLWLRSVGVCVNKLLFHYYNDDSARYLLQFKQSVKELDFSSSPRILNKNLNQIGSCPRLTSLSLASCFKINSNTFRKFLKSNPQLERLNVSKTGLTSEIIPMFLTFGQSIQYLDMSGSPWLNQHHLGTLAKSLPRLRAINLDWTPVDIKSVIQFLKENPRIQSVKYHEISSFDAEDISFLVQVALRSVTSSDIDSKVFGLENIRVLLRCIPDCTFETIQVSELLRHLVQSLTHPSLVCLIPIASPITSFSLGGPENCLVYRFFIFTLPFRNFGFHC